MVNHVIFRFLHGIYMIFTGSIWVLSLWTPPKIVNLRENLPRFDVVAGTASPKARPALSTGRCAETSRGAFGRKDVCSRWTFWVGWLVGWLIMVNQWLWLIMVNHGMHTFLILRSSDLCWFWYMLVVIGCHGFRCVFLVYVQLDKANIREYSDRRLKALRVEVIVSLSMGSMFTVLMFWHPYNLWLCSDLSSNHSKIQGHDVWMILNVVDPFLFGLSLNSIRSTAKSTHVRQGLSLMGTLKR